MKNSINLVPKPSMKIARIMEFDRMEIDNPIFFHPISLQYFDRINFITSYIKKKYSPKNTKVAEFGCAQANMSLLLSEEGYDTYAIDIDNDFLEYSKLKYEFGNISWICSNIEDLSMQKNFFDVIILGEVVEHCAYPEEIVKKVSEFLKVDGVMIITTPNGSRIKTNMKTFKDFIDPSKREELKKKQFAPDGEGHLFLFTLDELPLIIPTNLNLIKKGYLGSTLLFVILYKMRYIFPYFLFKKNALLKINRCLSNLLIFNKLTYNNIYIVLKKNN